MASSKAKIQLIAMVAAWDRLVRESWRAGRRPPAWYWSNRDNPEFWAEWERRFPRSETEGTAESLRAELEHR